MIIKINENDTIEVAFADGINTAIASIPFLRLKELLMDIAYETITKPECNSSSCTVNNFCECDPINEDMEFAGMVLNSSSHD